MTSRNIATIKKQFPIFKRTIHGKPLVYLDNASTSQKPVQVIGAIQKFYETTNANIHRGIHTLSEESTQHYEYTRKRVASFINARSSEEIVFTKNCTESINLVAWTWGATHIKRGDQIVVSALEHHANLVPWQELAKKNHASLCVIPLTADLTLDLDAYKKILTKKTKLVCITAQSNVLGVIPPIKEIVKLAHRVNARVFVDAAQSIGHRKTNVHALDCDFLAFSAHKMLGPTGVGILYAKKELLQNMQPFLFGGDMVTSVDQRNASYREAPWRFEAGTPNIADVIAFAQAIDFLEVLGMDAIEAYDHTLYEYAVKRFSRYAPVQLFVPKGQANSVLSFTIKGVHPHDIATIFDMGGVAIRSGLHCAEPLVRSLGVESTARMSFYLYNTKEDIDRAEQALKKIFHVFSLNPKR